MDGVERIMVLGIFAVIVAILGVAAWSVTQDDLGTTDDQQTGATAQAKTEVRGPQDLMGGQSAPGAPSVAGPGLGFQALSDPRKGRGTPKQPERALDQRLAGGPQGAGARGQDLLAQGGSKALDRTGNGRETLDLGPRGATGPISLRADTKSGGQGDEAVEKSPVKPTHPTYTVRKHDTLWSIASKHVPGSAPVKQKLAELQRLNPGVRAESMGEGLVLKLPGKALAAPAPETPAVPVSGDGETRLYTVVSGDNLSSIASSQLGSEGRWREIFELNKDRLSAPETIHVGQTLRLPSE